MSRKQRKGFSIKIKPKDNKLGATSAMLKGIKGKGGSHDAPSKDEQAWEEAQQEIQDALEDLEDEGG